MLVVLAIGALALGVAMPSLFAARDAAAFRAEAARVGGSAATLRSRAWLSGTARSLPGSYEGLPEGWILRGGPVVALPSGACLGGTLTLEAPSGRSADLVFEPPACTLASR